MLKTFGKIGGKLEIFADPTALGGKRAIAKEPLPNNSISGFIPGVIMPKCLLNPKLSRESFNLNTFIFRKECVLVGFSDAIDSCNPLAIANPLNYGGACKGTICIIPNNDNFDHVIHKIEAQGEVIFESLNEKLKCLKGTDFEELSSNDFLLFSHNNGGVGRDGFVTVDHGPMLSGFYTRVEPRRVDFACCHTENKILPEGHKLILCDCDRVHGCEHKSFIVVNTEEEKQFVEYAKENGLTIYDKGTNVYGSRLEEVEMNKRRSNQIKRELEGRDVRHNLRKIFSVPGPDVFATMSGMTIEDLKALDLDRYDETKFPSLTPQRVAVKKMEAEGESEDEEESEEESDDEEESEDAEEPEVEKEPEVEQESEVEKPKKRRRIVPTVAVDEVGGAKAGKSPESAKRRRRLEMGDAEDKSDGAGH
jgi:hypothetical protein